MSTAAADYVPPVDQPPPPARYGGFWARFGALFVDGWIIILISMAAISGAVLVVSGKLSYYESGSLVPITIAMFYHGYFISSARMATPGKRLFGLYVTDLQGQRLSLGHAVGRHLASALSYLTLFIGFIMVAFSDRKQALHDRMAGTLVHRQPGESTGGMIVVFLLLFVVVFGGGLMYFAGIPAIYDYGLRQEGDKIYQIMSANKVPIQDYAKKNHAWPTTWEQVESADGKNPMSQLEPLTREMVKDIRIEPDASMVADIEIPMKSGKDKTGKLRLTPQRVGNALGWNCTASPEIVQYMPETCGAKE